MKIDELIEKHQQAVAEDVAEKANKLQALIADKQVIFQNDAKRHARDLWDQLRPEGTLLYLTDRKDEIRYEIPVSWGGRGGSIKQSYDIRSEKWSNLHLTFGYLSDGSKTHTFELNLPATDQAFGAFFSLLQKCLVFNEEAEKVIKARDLKILLDFSHLNENGVDNRLKDAVARFPEHEEDFIKKAEEQLAILEQEAGKRLINQLAFELASSEREQLGLLAEYSWRGPFMIHKVVYGARMSGNENDDLGAYTDHFYTMMDTPYSSGYWQAFQNGEYRRHIKPVNVISIETIIIKSNGEAPEDLRRWTNLYSKVVKDVSIGTFLPPQELFNFDYDALRVAMEAEQDTEFANAAQEDNS